MKVTYLEHSGFFLELERICLLFDYWKGELPAPVGDKRLLVFASHAHHDHFVREIFSYGEQWRETHYLLGNDIRLSAKRQAEWGVPADRTHRMGADQNMVLDGAEIRTLRSTDAGVAFLVQAERKTIYHAGDLNWWVWDGEPEEDNAAMTAAFLQETEKLRGLPIDLAFLTLDGRQETDAFRGFDHCMRRLEICCAVPMHSFGDYAPHRAILADPVSEPYRSRIRLMTEPGMQIVLE